MITWNDFDSKIWTTKLCHENFGELVDSLFNSPDCKLQIE